MKRAGIVLTVIALVLSLFTPATPAKAWPGVPDRAAMHGYFHNIYDNASLDGPMGDVMPYGIPGWVDSADEFIGFINSKLAEGPGSQNGVAAAFIIQTMIGRLSRNSPPNADERADWEARVRYAEAQGRVSWNVVVSYVTNSLYQGNGPGANPNDDAFYNESSPHSDAAIVFRDMSGNPTYMIRIVCGNPVGYTNPIPAAPRYTLTGRSTVSSPTAIPGATVSFSHYIRNSGPDAATTNWTTRIDPGGAPINSGTSSIGSGDEVNVRNENFTIPANAAFGTRYCRYITFTPYQNGIGTGTGVSAACVTVVAQFDVQPLATPSASTAQQNDTITFTYSIANSGPTRTTNLTCKVTSNSQGPGYTPLPQQDNDRNPAANPQPATNCNAELPIGTTQVGTETVDVGNAAPGSRICRSLVINPRSQTGGFRASAEGCVIIAKTPYVHFKGNDVWAGGGFQAITPGCNALSKIQTVGKTLKDTTIAGSATEYGAFALGKILNFGSANKAIVNPAAPNGKTLTFSNFDTANLGYFGSPQHCINDYISRYSSVPVTAEPGSIDIGARGNGTWHVTGNRQFTGNIPAGAQQIYLVEGDVTITGDLRYPASYTNLGQIPSLVIIATGNVTVQSGVRQMDGVFITRGTFATCDPGPGNLSVSICNQQLVINGAVAANNVSLLRTAGADGNDDTARKQPAEMFNFNAELYIRNALNGTNGIILRTVDQKDLPPRF